MVSLVKEIGCNLRILLVEVLIFFLKGRVGCEVALFQLILFPSLIGKELLAAFRVHIFIFLKLIHNIIVILPKALNVVGQISTHFLIT